MDDGFIDQDPIRHAVSRTILATSGTVMVGSGRRPSVRRLRAAAGELFVLGFPARAARDHCGGIAAGLAQRLQEEQPKREGGIAFGDARRRSL